jgi:hypothetical protein
MSCLFGGQSGPRRGERSSRLISASSAQLDRAGVNEIKATQDPTAHAE